MSDDDNRYSGKVWFDSRKKTRYALNTRLISKLGMTTGMLTAYMLTKDLNEEIKEHFSNNLILTDYIVGKGDCLAIVRARRILILNELVRSKLYKANRKLRLDDVMSNHLRGMGHDVPDPQMVIGNLTKPLEAARLYDANNMAECRPHMGLSGGISVYNRADNRSTWSHCNRPLCFWCKLRKLDGLRIALNKALTKSVKPMMVNVLVMPVMGVKPSEFNKLKLTKRIREVMGHYSRFKLKNAKPICGAVGVRLFPARDLYENVNIDASFSIIWLTEGSQPSEYRTRQSYKTKAGVTVDVLWKSHKATELGVVEIMRFFSGLDSRDFESYEDQIVLRSILSDKYPSLVARFGSIRGLN